MLNSTPRTFVGSATASVRGMTCGHCERAVSQEVGQVDGVRDVRVDLAAGTVTVTVDRPVDRADIAAAVTAARRHRRRKLVVHYVEMVIAMAVGMVALHPVWTFVLDAVGWSAFLDAPEAMAMVMATNMTIAMTAWTKFRGHGWLACAEMGAAMYLPFLALFPFMWAGLLTSGGMLLWGHVLMLFAMAGAMALRPHEYAHC